MKLRNLLLIITIIAAIGFSIAGCDNGSNNEDPNLSGGDDKTDTFVDDKTNTFVPVTNITDVPTTSALGIALTLTGTVVPDNATNKTISWSVVSGMASVKGSTLNAFLTGQVTVKATIANGTAQGTNFSKDFNITVSGGVSAIYGVAYGNGRFVAVGGPLGSEKQIAYSDDGVTWTASTDHPFGNGMINAVAFGNGKFVAVGSGINNKSMTAYSTDGVNWTAVTNITSPNSNILDIVWGADKFVIGGQNGMAYSADGVAWTTVPNSNAFDSMIERIGWGDGKFVAGTKNIAYSQDGITWTKAADDSFSMDLVSKTDGRIHSFAYGSGKYVAVGRYITGIVGYQEVQYSRIAYSTDANNWTVVDDTTFGSAAVSAVCYGNGKFVAGGEIDGKIAYSTDGENWTAVTDNNFGTTIHDITWGGDKFVAVGAYSRIMYSTDGINWTAVADSTFE